MANTKTDTEIDTAKTMIDTETDSEKDGQITLTIQSGKLVLKIIFFLTKSSVSDLYRFKKTYMYIYICTYNMHMASIHELYFDFGQKS